MGIQLACDQCGLLDGGDRGVLYALGHVSADPGSLQVRPYEYPTLLHWGCITDFIRRRDTQDQEPPF